MGDVGADHDGQLDDLAITEMRAQGIEGVVGYHDVARNRIDIAERRAFAVVEPVRAAPIGQGVSVFPREPLGGGERGDVLAQHIGRADQMAQADDDDLAQSAVDAGAPTHPVDVLEPAFRQRRAVQQRPVTLITLPRRAP